MAFVGGGTSADGPLSDGSGSKRESALRIAPDGGSARLRSRRIAERSRSRRSPGEVVAWSVTAPMIQAIPSPIHAVSAAPRIPSIVLRPGTRKAKRRRIPSPSRQVASRAPTSSAPTSPNSGAYTEREPLASTSGPTRVPSTAPRANPASDKPPTMMPCMYPQKANRAAKATINQSIPFTRSL
jgi:hypothetical protein